MNDARANHFDNKNLIYDSKSKTDSADCCKNDERLYKYDLGARPITSYRVRSAVIAKNKKEATEKQMEADAAAASSLALFSTDLIDKEQSGVHRGHIYTVFHHFCSSPQSLFCSCYLESL